MEINALITVSEIDKAIYSNNITEVAKRFEGHENFGENENKKKISELKELLKNINDRKIEIKKPVKEFERELKELNKPLLDILEAMEARKKEFKSKDMAKYKDALETFLDAENLKVDDLTPWLKAGSFTQQGRVNKKTKEELTRRAAECEIIAACNKKKLNSQHFLKLLTEDNLGAVLNAIDLSIVVAVPVEQERIVEIKSKVMRRYAGYDS